MHRLRSLIRDRLQGLYSPDELKVLTLELCRHLPGIRENDFYLDTALQPSAERDAMLCGWLDRLSRGEPLQYVTGWTEFCGCRLKCDRRALIPRPETTELVEWISGEAGPSGSLLDIGTGSGCIAVALASVLPGWRVSAWDVSDEALSLAGENCRLAGVDVALGHHDILSPEDSSGTFDVIVSNPPYIAMSESHGMERNVLDYEPHLALFVPDGDPLVFYRAIAGFGLTHLAGRHSEGRHSEGRHSEGQGAIYFEINPLYAQQLESMLCGMGYTVTFRNDISGRRRMAKAYLNHE